MKDMVWLRGMGRRAKKEREMSKRRKTFSSSSILPSLEIKGVGPFSFCSYTGEHLPHSSRVLYILHSLQQNYNNENYSRLSPGEAIWVPAGQIHAYVSGDCVEVGA